MATAWKQEARRRLAEIQDGLDQAVDGEEVSAQVRRIVGL
ncbi:MAG: addiction module protein [Bryobacteraceae bacterium]